MHRIEALLISNGIAGLEQQFRSNDRVRYSIAEIGPDFDPELQGYDLVIAPNGTDHVALYRIRHKIKAFLDAGGTLFCFDGWFSDWIPGNRWIMDNSKKTIDIRYLLGEDPDGLGKLFSIADLNFSHGISGWWACGYIEPAPSATVLIADTWGRALAVIDRVSTKGLIVMTASGPLADYSYATTDDDRSTKAMTDLYQAMLTLIPAPTTK
jgi:hypothetical protein